MWNGEQFPPQQTLDFFGKAIHEDGAAAVCGILALQFFYDVSFWPTEPVVFRLAGSSLPRANGSDCGYNRDQFSRLQIPYF